MTKEQEPSGEGEPPECGSDRYTFVASQGHQLRLECDFCRSTYHVHPEQLPHGMWEEPEY